MSNISPDDPTTRLVMRHLLATLAYRALRRGWHTALRAIYWIEHPSRRGQLAHFFPRLVASGRA